MAWPQLIEALLLVTGGLALLGGWYVARRRERPAEQALRLNEERFRQLTTLSADWFWETDAEYRLKWLSGGPAMAALFDSGPGYGKRLWELPGVEVKPRRLVDHLERLLHIDAQLPLFDFEVSAKDGDAVRCVHEVLGRPCHDAAGRFLGYRGVGRDVTSKRRAERALAEAKERLELATEGGNLAVWDCDVANDRMFLSEGWAKILGKEPLARTMRSADLLESLHPEDRAAAGEAYSSALTGSAPGYHAEYRVKTDDGHWKWVDSTGRVTQRDAAGRALRLSGAVIDVDARKRAEQATRDAEERYRSLIELAPDGVTVFSNGIIEYANPAAARIMKAGSPRDLLGRKVEDFVHPDHRARFAERAGYLAAGPGVTGFEERKLLGADGSEVLVEAASVSYLERGRLVMQSVLRDVSEQRRAREALAEREKRFRDVVEASGEYVWETDAVWRYSFLSERVESLLGYMRHEMLGRKPQDFMPLDEARATYGWFAQHAVEGKPFRGLEHRSIGKSGRVIWQQVSGVPVFDAAGGLRGYRGTGADITARKHAEKRIEYLATRDALTGLPNRALLADRADQAILTAARSRGGLALLFIDLDRFKLVNDTLGHTAGDALLRAVAERLGATLRGDDTLARLSGDEFALLWNGMQSSQEAATLAQRALGMLARPFTIEGRTLSVTASIGISVCPGDGRDFSELLKNADAAANHAKETGRNSFRFYSPELNARASALLALENDLHHALARGELALRWQPVAAIPSPTAGPGGLVGAEALLRWQHPREGLLLPDRFIPVAEDCGLIGALGQWVLERALSQIAAWRRGGAEGLWFAINVSAHELAQGEAYTTRLAEALAAHGVPGSCLELEVTERVLMSHLPENIETLRRIGSLGVRVAIDDFGTGYSSLAYLRQLPIDKLKIDRSFLRDLDAHPQDATIVQTIAAMARALGLRVAAEGVESEGQLAHIAALGCDEWQGHHYSAALEAAEFERLLAPVTGSRAAAR